MNAPRILVAGEAAIVAQFGETADPLFHDRVLALDAALAAAAPLDGVLETVPTYRSLMIHFDPRLLTGADVAAHLARLDPASVERKEPRRWRVPACWDPPHDEDLREVAQALGMAPDRVVALHAEASYRVVMYGFAPGFVFLAGLPEALTISRRSIPRASAQPGALTIAAGQALIASVSMPTGWYVLGRTPVRTFDPVREPAFPIGIGDEIVFDRIDAASFEALDRRAAAGESLFDAAAIR